jgi:hypothetical protein
LEFEVERKRYKPFGGREVSSRLGEVFSLRNLRNFIKILHNICAKIELCPYDL